MQQEPLLQNKSVNGFESHPMQVTWKKSTRSNFFLHTFQKTIKFSVLFVADASLDNALPPVVLMTAASFLNSLFSILKCVYEFDSKKVIFEVFLEQF